MGRSCTEPLSLSLSLSLFFSLSRRRGRRVAVKLADAELDAVKISSKDAKLTSAANKKVAELKATVNRIHNGSCRCDVMISRLCLMGPA